MLNMTMRKEFEALGDRSAAETITLLRHSADFSDRRLLADELRIKFVYATVDLYNLTDQLRSKLDLVKTGAREIRLLRHDWDADKLREEAAIEKAARKDSHTGDASKEPGVTLENLEAAARDLSKGVAEMKAELLKKLNGEKAASEEDHTSTSQPPSTEPSNETGGPPLLEEQDGEKSLPPERTASDASTDGNIPEMNPPPHSQAHRTQPSASSSGGKRARGSRRLG